MDVESAFVDGIDVREVKWVEKKIEATLLKRNGLRRWQPTPEFRCFKRQCLIKLQKQLEFLIAVQRVKSAAKDAKDDLKYLDRFLEKDIESEITTED